MTELPVTYRARPQKWVLVLVGSGIFVWVGLWLRAEQPFLAYPSIIFFGLCALAALVGLLPNSSYLTLTEGGFEVASLYRKHFVSWADVESFLPIEVRSRRMVGWNYSPAFRKSPRLRRVNTALAGAEAALPDTYGMSPEALADLMNQLRNIQLLSQRSLAYQPNVNA